MEVDFRVQAGTMLAKVVRARPDFLPLWTVGHGAPESLVRGGSRDDTVDAFTVAVQVILCTETFSDPVTAQLLAFE